MQIGTEKEMSDLVAFALEQVDDLEAVFLQACFLSEPTMTLANFAKRHQLSQKAMKQLRQNADQKLRSALAERGIFSLQDIL